MVRKTKPKRTEAMIQRAIMDYLRSLSSLRTDIYVFRAGVGAFKTEQGRYVKTGRPGLPDIILCKGGQFIGLEVKTEKGRQSQSQKTAEKDITGAGGEYHIVRSVGDVKRICEPT